MQVEIKPNSLCGNVKAISSKSDAHRGIICASLADKKTKIFISETSQDIEATISCVKALGANIEKNGNLYEISPIKKINKNSVLDCSESGSTLRFLLPVVAALGAEATFQGRGRLPERPMGLITELLEKKGNSFNSNTLPLKVSGKTQPGEFEIEGNVSSQFISGLLFSLPLLADKSRIKLLSKLESAAYVDMTISTLKRFGIDIECKKDGYEIASSFKYLSPHEYVVEGDWSNSAFFLVAAALAGKIMMNGLDFESKQSDKAILDILNLAGVKPEISGSNITIKKSTLKPFSADVSQYPDLFPIMAILACGAKGKSLLYNAKRLRIKESDRIKTTKELILALGGNAEETEDSLIIYGTGKLKGGYVNSYNDHRIAMSAYIASTICEECVILDGAEAVNKSYPDFLRDFENVGGKVNVI